mmetsp:Transcript_68189/g.215821  ORF Transcript_68189/g.215821 Transcript_68189/m.215821 type:complete len:473 (-) Transcript_68189:103-1521(-)
MAKNRAQRRCGIAQKLLLGGAVASAALLLWQVAPLVREAPGHADGPPFEWPPPPVATVAPDPAPEQPPVAQPPPRQEDAGGTEKAGTVERVAGAGGASQLLNSVAPVAAVRETGLLIVLACGLGQWQQLLVAINSAVVHAADPSQLHFRIVTLSADAVALLSKLRGRLPGETDLEAVPFDAWLPRVSSLLGGSSSSRKELFGALNFAAFYVHELFPGAQRVLYLDTDVVVLADLASSLATRDLQGRSSAAAQDCSQHLGKYVDLGRLKRKNVQAQLPLQLKARKDTCVANRGVVLVDVARWRAENITGAIEALVRAHLSRRGPLWRSGVSQPPFLLAIAGRYHDLGAEFNVRGLGRGDIAPEEVAHYRKLGLWSRYYDGFLRKCEIHCCPGCKGWALTPHIAPDAHLAKVLHFNGRLKPPAGERRGLAPVPPPGPGLSREARGARELTPLCGCGPRCLQECAGLWWKYLPPS